jgi:hypothetical protein
MHVPLDPIVVKRSARLDLSHVLDDSRPTPAIPIIEKRIHTRFDKAFLVVIGSEAFGDSYAIARNVSAGGILVEMSYAPPLGAIVTVHFEHDGNEMVARAEVKHHHYLNFGGGPDAARVRGVGLRFVEFVDTGLPIDPERIH